MAKGSPGGKGDAPRPINNPEEYAKNFEAIFGKKELNNGYFDKSTEGKSSETPSEQGR